MNDGGPPRLKGSNIVPERLNVLICYFSEKAR
jgi:hypothetical protein